MAWCRRRWIGIGLTCLLITGCATQRPGPDIEDGMTSKEVVDILGKPDRVSRRGSHYLAYQYSDRKIGDRSLGSNYVVIFKDDRVEAHGPGRLRVNPSTSMGMFIIMPFR